MIGEVENKDLVYIKDVLNKEFNISYDRGTFSKEIVYKEDNKIVGIIIYSIIYDRIELDYIYVDVLKRNIGIASKLLFYMFEDAEKNNITNITLEVNVDNNKAISLYKKYGFKIVATREKYYNGEDGYLMIRE